MPKVFPIGCRGLLESHRLDKTYKASRTFDLKLYIQLWYRKTCYKICVLFKNKARAKDLVALFFKEAPCQMMGAGDQDDLGP